jgi:uncharacterized protein YkwD
MSVVCWGKALFGNALVGGCLAFSLACGGGGGGVSGSNSVANASSGVVSTISAIQQAADFSVRLAGQSTVLSSSGEQTTRFKSSLQKSLPSSIRLMKADGSTVQLNQTKDNLYEGSVQLKQGDAYLLKANGIEGEWRVYGVYKGTEKDSPVQMNSKAHAQAQYLEKHLRSKSNVDTELGVIGAVAADAAVIDQIAAGVVDTIKDGNITVNIKGSGSMDLALNKEPKVSLATTSYSLSQRHWSETVETLTGYGQVVVTFPAGSSENLVSFKAFQGVYELSSGAQPNAFGLRTNTFFVNEGEDVRLEVEFNPPTTLVETAGVDAVNAVRSQAGMTSLSGNVLLETAASDHANYLVTHKPTSTLADAWTVQSPLLQYYTAKTSSERASFRGYQGTAMEGIAQGEVTVASSVDQMMSSIYQRFNILDHSIAEVGIGRSNVLPLSAERFGQVDVLSLGVLPTSSTNTSAGNTTNAAVSGNGNAAVVVWPVDGSSNIMPVMASTVPHPASSYGTVGYPITVHFDDSVPLTTPGVVVVSLANVQMNLSKVVSGNTLDIPLVTLASNTDPWSLMKETQFAWIPQNRLDFSTTYSANLSYDLGGQPQLATWSFSTRASDFPLLEIGASQNVETVIAGKDYSLYFPPSSAMNAIEHISFASQNGAEAQIEISDTNTLSFCVHGELGSGVILTLNRSRSMSLVVGSSDRLVASGNAQ